MSAQWVWATAVWPWVFPDRWSLLWDLLCSEAQHQTPLVQQPTTSCGLVGAKGALEWGSICCASPGTKDAGGCMGEKMDWAFWGSALCPMGCRLGREQGFAQFRGPYRSPRQQLTAATQLTRLLFGKDVGGWVLEITLCRLIELLLLICVLPVPVSGWFLRLQRPVVFPLN